MQVVLVYLQPFWHNSLLKCVSQPKIAKNSLKSPILGVQGHSRSSMLTFLRSSLPVLAMISSMSVPICNHFHGSRANNGEITLFKGVLSFFPSFVRIPFTQWREILSQNTRDSMLSYGKNQKSLFHLGSDQYRVVTDIKTELPQLIRAIASYASSRA